MQEIAIVFIGLALCLAAVAPVIFAGAHIQKNKASTQDSLFAVALFSVLSMAFVGDAFIYILTH